MTSTKSFHHSRESLSINLFPKDKDVSEVVDPLPQHLALPPKQLRRKMSKNNNPKRRKSLRRRRSQRKPLKKKMTAIWEDSSTDHLRP
jgi:hypothetical protein